MNRFIDLQLNKVSPTPVSLRRHPQHDEPVDTTDVHLGKLFLHQYCDSFPAGPPKTDASRFEYVDLISASDDFRFHAFVAEASTVKKRAISTEIGQAFCRLMLEEHFGVSFFAHMGDVLNKPPHPALGGMSIKRIASGDVPDYICVGRHGTPLVAEAKGRFSKISFGSSEFDKWRDQFERILLLDKNSQARSAKGYIVATQFGATGKQQKSCCFIEDPATTGELPLGDTGPLFSRFITALHYSYIFRKLGLDPLASALYNGFALTRELRIQTQVWTCHVPPFEGVEFVGGFYRTTAGPLPQWTASGWLQSPELGAGHAMFIGVQRNISVAVAEAGRGNWNQLFDLPSMQANGFGPSDIAWLTDGTITAPVIYFTPTTIQVL